MIKKKWYVVWVGRGPGIYENWADCEAQVKGFPNARYMSFKTREEAEEAFKEDPEDYWGKKDQLARRRIEKGLHKDVNRNSIAVDVSCRGPYGPMEFRGINLTTNEFVFIMGPYQKGTNNIGEFLAVVEALKYISRIQKPMIIYTDSLTAMAWVRDRICNTELPRTEESEDIFIMIDEALEWLHNNDYSTEIQKWNTDEWGEVPADYGRK